MAGIHYIDDGRYVRVEHTYADAGKDRVMAMNGREKVVLEIGTAAAPAIWELTNGGFYYKGSLEPVTKMSVFRKHGSFYRQEQNEELTEEERQLQPQYARAEEWVEICSSGGVKSATIEVAEKPEVRTYKDATPASAPPIQEAVPDFPFKKSPSGKHIVIKDEASFRDAAGRPSVT